VLRLPEQEIKAEPSVYFLSIFLRFLDKIFLKILSKIFSKILSTNKGDVLSLFRHFIPQKSIKNLSVKILVKIMLVNLLVS